MQTDILQKVIAEWITGDQLPALVAREQSLPDFNELTQILAIVGPRRAGKTFFIYQIIANLINTGQAKRDQILFIDFEDYRLKDFGTDDVERLLAAFFQITGRAPRYLFFDEIQKMPDWSRMLRTLHNSRKYKIIVTGSNATLFGSAVATELRGRYLDNLILPFSFREYLKLLGIQWNQALLLTPERGKIVKAFDEYLQYGGFPEAAKAQGEAAKRQLLQMYFDTVFYKDMADRYGIRARYLLDLIMRNMLEGYASLFSVSTFEKQLKARGQTGSKRSIADYLRRLEEVFFITTCEKFDFSPRKRTMNPKKVFLMDNGFALLSGAFTENRGRLLENVAALEFFRRRQRVLYFRNKAECDFIVEQNRKPTEAWQVCWELNAGNEKREIKGLLAAMTEFKIDTGGILTYDQEEARNIHGMDIRIIPVWKWLLNEDYSLIKKAGNSSLMEEVKA